MSLRVTAIDSYRRWREDPEGDLAQILEVLRGQGPENEPMRVGTALHKALELAEPGSFSSLSANGYQFFFDIRETLYLSKVREMLVQTYYPGVTVRGRVDLLDGNTVEDHKTTSRPLDAEALESGYQWRGYLSMLKADRFVWNVFELEPAKAVMEMEKPVTIENAYRVRALHRLEQHRYPGMDNDWRALVSDTADFCSQHAPDLLESITCSR